MKRVNAELVYPDTTVAEVSAMLADPDFRSAVAAYQHALRSEVTVSPTAEGRRIVFEYAHGTDRVPSFAKRLVGDEIPIVQEEDWRSDAEARIRVTIPGKPGDMTGTARLTQRGDDVVEQVDLSVKVGIPLVGGKVEDLIAGLLEKAFRAENKVGVKWLAGEWEVGVRFRKEIHFVGTVEEVRAMLLDPEFRNQVALATNGEPTESRIEETPQGVRSVNEIRPALEELPAFARPVVGAGLVIHQEEHWTSENVAELSVRSPGRPGHIEGTITLSPDGEGTRQTTDAEITVNIPLVGRRVETLMGKILGNVLKAQGQLGNDWLTNRRA